MTSQPPSYGDRLLLLQTEDYYSGSAIENPSNISPSRWSLLQKKYCKYTSTERSQYIYIYNKGLKVLFKGSHLIKGMLTLKCLSTQECYLKAKIQNSKCTTTRIMKQHCDQIFTTTDTYPVRCESWHHYQPQIEFSLV